MSTIDKKCFYLALELQGDYFRAIQLKLLLLLIIWHQQWFDKLNHLYLVNNLYSQTWREEFFFPTYLMSL